jgi:hypothetical protein
MRKRSFVVTHGGGERGKEGRKKKSKELRKEGRKEGRLRSLKAVTVSSSGNGKVPLRH